MSRRPYWAIECLNEDEALTLLSSAPHGSKIEIVAKENTELVILWVPVPDDVIEHELG